LTYIVLVAALRVIGEQALAKMSARRRLRVRTFSRLRVDGKSYSRAWLREALVSAGGTLRFDLGDQPSRWRTPEEESPP
jgi:putative alpha-1,2-mannosidase